MKINLSKHQKLLVLGVVVLISIAIVAVVCFFALRDNGPKLQDLTIELGEPFPTADRFLTDGAKGEKVSFVTDINSLDITHIGAFDVTLRHSSGEETVKLTVKDTTAPTLALQDLVRPLGYVPVAKDFVVNSFDLSETTVDFAKPVDVTKGEDITVEIVITDAVGNSTTATAKLSIEWLLESVTWELGKPLEKTHLFVTGFNKAEALDQSQIDAINAGGVGEYTVTGSYQGKAGTCKVTVVDTTPPVLVLQDVYREKGAASPKLEDFVVSCTDLSDGVVLSFLTEPDTKADGTQVIKVQAKDPYGNTTVAEAEFKLVTDTTPPEFEGADPMTVEKNSTPDYEKGVKAVDEEDGAVKFTFDASKVNTAKAGTYYVTYTATDKSGNTGTYRRKVTVKHDGEDTKALVADFVKKYGTDAEVLRDNVRNRVGYSSNDGGEDPVYYGLTNMRGDCYVHAFVLEAVLREAGYECQLIWTTTKSHYWVLVKIDGNWKHIDSTPSRRHNRYSLMNDEQRFETLQIDFPEGRDWDRTKWPVSP